MVREEILNPRYQVFFVWVNVYIMYPDEYGNSERSPVFAGVRVARSLVFCVVFCESLFVIFLLAIILPVLLRFTGFKRFFLIIILFNKIN